MSSLNLNEDEKEYTVEDLKAILNDPKLPRAIIWSSIVKMVVTLGLFGIGIVLVVYLGYIAGAVYATILFIILWVVDKSRD